MRARVNRFVSAFAALGIWVAFPVSAAADEGESAGEDRWVPSLAVITGITYQPQDASLGAFRCAGSQAMCDPTDTPLFLGRPFDSAPLVSSGEDWAVSPYVGGNLQLMTPTIEIPGRPRAFVNGELLPTFAADRSIAKVGSPTGFGFPVGTIFPQEAIEGQGASTTATVDTWVFAAGIGMAFPFRWMGRRLWAKPSVGWLRYQVDVEGVVLKAFCRPSGPSTQCVSPGGSFDGFARFVSLGASDSQWFDGIGPGFELEIETGRFGPLGTSLFVDAHAYKILGNRDVQMSDSVTISDGLDDVLGAETYTGFWSFEVDSWMYRTGVGIRFQWLGSQR